jgi:membrane protease YdiL (CAAX protease family)
MILMTIFICWRCRVAIHRVGWDTKGLGKQLALGGAFAVLFVPPIYILMAIVTALSKQEYSHPIIEMMRENPSMLWLAIWSAVIVAPITEEFAFRVIIQGYLDSMAAGSFGSADIILGRQSYWPVLSLSHQVSVPPIDNDGLLENPADILAQQDRVNIESSAIAVKDSNPYAPPRDDSLQARLDARSVTNDKPVNMASLPIWPILVSGTLFGLLHYSYGVSWIPLIALGIVLGWLYRITGTIWPSLLVHMVVNGTSMWGLVSQILVGDKGP